MPVGRTQVLIIQRPQCGLPKVEVAGLWLRRPPQEWAPGAGTSCLALESSPLPQLWLSGPPLHGLAQHFSEELPVGEQVRLQGPLGGCRWRPQGLGATWTPPPRVGIEAFFLLSPTSLTRDCIYVTDTADRQMPFLAERGGRRGPWPKPRNMREGQHCLCPPISGDFFLESSGDSAEHRLMPTAPNLSCAE